MLSLTPRRPHPKHRAPTARRLPRAGRVVATTASAAAFTAAAAVTVHLSAASSAVSSASSPTSSAPPVAAATLGRPATGPVQRAVGSSDRGSAYSGAEARTVLESRARHQSVSRSGGRRPAADDTSSADGRSPDRTDQPQEQQRAQPAPPAWVLPATGYHLTAGFGECSGLWGNCHTGLDFAAPTGTPIRAVAAGTITEVGWAGAYGNRTVETLEDGTEIWYCHQDSVLVGLRTRVAAGQQIGRIGSTGNTTGPHLHLEVRPGGGDPVDPFTALTSHGLRP